MKVPLDLTKVFQGILLFYVLACDSLILYRVRLDPVARRKPAHGCLKPSLLVGDRRARRRCCWRPPASCVVEARRAC